MKKSIILILMALVLSFANSVQAAYPQHVYAFGANGGTLDKGWGTGLELENLGDGVYVYKGMMSNGLIGFVGFNDDNRWDTGTNDFYFSNQNGYNADLVDCEAKVYHYLPDGFMNYMFNVQSAGEAEIRLTLSEDGENVDIDFTLSAPEHVYMVGASPSSFDLSNPTEMTNEGNGKFIYEGPLYYASMTLICKVGTYECLRIGPTIGGTDIRFVNESALYYFLYNGNDPRYEVKEKGTYRVEVQFEKDNTGRIIPNVTATRLGDLPPMITVTGHAEHWFSREEAKKIIYPNEDNPDVFVWTGEITESYGNRWHFCFASNPGWDHTMYVPVTTNFETGSYPVYVAELGVEIPYEEVAGIADNWKFFGIADADFGPIKATLNKATKTVKFEKISDYHYPEHVYAFGANGGCMDKGWTNGLELENQGNGVYVYKGMISNGQIGFVGFDDDNRWDTGTNDFYFSNQNAYNADLMGCEAKVYHYLPDGFTNYMFNVQSAGEAEIRLTISEEGENVAIDFTLSAPDHLYLVGGVLSAYDLNEPTEMESDGNGSFTYDGPLFKGNLTMDAGTGDYLCLRVGPTVGGADITNAGESTIFYFLYNGGDPRYTISENGMYHIDVQFTKADNGYLVPTVTSTRTGDLSMVAITGHSVHWFSREEAKHVIYASEDNPDEFVWTGNIDPDPDGNGWHFCLTSNPGQDYVNYVPEEITHANGWSHMATLGTEIPYKELPKDHEDGWKFFGINDSDCGPIKMTLNKTNQTVKFEKWIQTGIDDVKADNMLRARFDGDILVVENNEADIEVFDLAGRRIATGNDANISAAGIYILRSGKQVIKIRK